MSLPDYLLEPEDESVCECCGEEPICRRSQRLCSTCLIDYQEAAAEEAYEAKWERMRELREEERA